MDELIKLCHSSYTNFVNAAEEEAKKENPDLQKIELLLQSADNNMISAQKGQALKRDRKIAVLLQQNNPQLELQD
jgi:hypothetical protein